MGRAGITSAIAGKGPSTKGRSIRKKVSVPKKKKVTKSFIRSNAMAINSLNRQVKHLQLAAYGSYQTNLQIQKGGPIIPLAQSPALLDLTDFTCQRVGALNDFGAQLYQYSTAFPPVLTGRGLWEVSPLGQNVFWKNYNEQRPGETGQYLPMYAKYTVNITGVPTLSDTRIRLDCFSQKAKTIVTNIQAEDDLRLPGALSALTDMASPQLNRINPAYFNKYWSKTFYLNSTNTATRIGTTGNTIRYTFVVKPKHPRKQLVTNFNPIIPVIDLSGVEQAINDHIDHSDHSSAESDVELGAPPVDNIVGLDYSPFNSAVDAPLYLLISTTDTTAALSNQVQITMSRRLGWRDWEGTTGA